MGEVITQNMYDSGGLPLDDVSRYQKRLELYRNHSNTKEKRFQQAAPHLQQASADHTNLLLKTWNDGKEKKKKPNNSNKRKQANAIGPNGLNNNHKVFDFQDETGGGASDSHAKAKRPKADKSKTSTQSNTHVSVQIDVRNSDPSSRVTASLLIHNNVQHDAATANFDIPDGVNVKSERPDPTTTFPQPPPAQPAPPPDGAKLERLLEPSSFLKDDFDAFSDIELGGLPMDFGADGDLDVDAWFKTLVDSDELMKAIGVDPNSDAPSFDDAGYPPDEDKSAPSETKVNVSQSTSVHVTGGDVNVQQTQSVEVSCVGSATVSADSSVTVSASNASQQAYSAYPPQPTPSSCAQPSHATYTSQTTTNTSYTTATSQYATQQYTHVEQQYQYSTTSMPDSEPPSLTRLSHYTAPTPAATTAATSSYPAASSTTPGAMNYHMYDTMQQQQQYASTMMTPEQRQEAEMQRRTKAAYEYERRAAAMQQYTGAAPPGVVSQQAMSPTMQYGGTVSPSLRTTMSPSHLAMMQQQHGGAAAAAVAHQRALSHEQSLQQLKQEAHDDFKRQQMLSYHQHNEMFGRAQSMPGGASQAGEYPRPPSGSELMLLSSTDPRAAVTPPAHLRRPAGLPSASPYATAAPPSMLQRHRSSSDFAAMQPTMAPGGALSAAEMSVLHAKQQRLAAIRQHQEQAAAAAGYHGAEMAGQQRLMSAANAPAPPMSISREAAMREAAINSGMMPMSAAGSAGMMPGVAGSAASRLQMTAQHSQLMIQQQQQQYQEVMRQRMMMSQSSGMAAGPSSAQMQAQMYRQQQYSQQIYASQMQQRYPPAM